MKKRTRKGQGFTIIEVIVIVVILGIIATVIAPRLFSRVGQARTSAAENGAATLASLVAGYQIDHGKPPRGATLEDVLWAKPSNVPDAEWEPYVNKLADLIDPWGNKYVLVIPGEVNIDFDVVSRGSDGQPGGEGDAKDIIKP